MPERATKVSLYKFKEYAGPLHIKSIDRISICTVIGGEVRSDPPSDPSIKPYFTVEMHYVVNKTSTHKIMLTDGEGWMAVAPPGDSREFYARDWEFNQADRSKILKAISEYCQNLDN